MHVSMLGLGAKNMTIASDVKPRRRSIMAKDSAITAGSVALGRKNKFGNTPTVIDGISFPSKREAARYVDLKLLVKAGEISDLELQPTYAMIVNGRKICSYRADFRYTDHGKQIVEDCKGVRTPVYRIKAKLMRACYGIEICET